MTKSQQTQQEIQQVMMPQIRSHIDYLIQIYHILVPM